MERPSNGRYLVPARPLSPNRMKLLLIHSDFIEYEAREETPVAEEDVEPTGRLEEALTAFVAVESGDADDVDGVIAAGLDEIRDVADELGVDGVMVYPYAHLSDDLADPDLAVAVLEGIEEGLTGEYDQVKRAPFGWYKAFQLSCKGHPMSELSRSIDARELGGEQDEESDEDEEAAPSSYHVLTPDGELVEADDALADAGSATEDALAALIRDELGDAPAAEVEPPHIATMTEKEFVGYDALSDPGNFRWYPRGKQVRDLLIDYVDDLVVDYGGMPVETPIMYDLGETCIHEHSAKFGERQYRFESGDREMMLRFAACFGQFSIMRDMHISEADLPLRIYEMSTYSFRREQRGELSGLTRLRAFTMPDMHTACRDLDEAKQEFRDQAVLGYETGDDLGLDYVAALRVTDAFYDDNADWIEDVVEEIGEPVLLERIPERKHYWSAKIDLAAIDAQGRPMENPTVQIDVESAERFDVTYHEGDSESHPILLHYSPSGSIERAFAALLETVAAEQQAIDEEGREGAAGLPTWLAPSQVRLVPIGEDHVERCDEVADRLASASIRADVDDRDESVGKRIRRANTDWAPYVAVVGDEELASGTVSVTERATGEERELSAEELVEEVDTAIGDRPRERLYMDRHLSRRPRFE